MYSFIKEDAHVYFVHPACVEEPGREGYVEYVHDDRTVDVDDKYLGSVNVSRDMVFETMEDAESAAAEADKPRLGVGDTCYFTVNQDAAIHQGVILYISEGSDGSFDVAAICDRTSGDQVYKVMDYVFPTYQEAVANV